MRYFRRQSRSGLQLTPVCMSNSLFSTLAPDLDSVIGTGFSLAGKVCSTSWLPVSSSASCLSPKTRPPLVLSPNDLSVSCRLCYRHCVWRLSRLVVWHWPPQCKPQGGRCWWWALPGAPTFWGYWSGATSGHLQLHAANVY